MVTCAVTSLTGEQLIALITLLVATLSGGIGASFKRWADAKVVKETAALQAEASQSKALSDAWLRMVDAAEKREAASNDRVEKALAGLAAVTAALSEQTAASKMMLEEIKRGSESLAANKTTLEEVRRVVTQLDASFRERR